MKNVMKLIITFGIKAVFSWWEAIKGDRSECVYPVCQSMFYLGFLWAKKQQEEKKMVLNVCVCLPPGTLVPRQFSFYQ